jgi:YteA family regulatory protein
MTVTHLTKPQLEKLKRLLLERKAELADLLARDGHGLERPMGESAPELSQYDNHPGDTGTELFERSKDLALVDKAEHELEQTELALAGMETGRYGICAVCGEPIPYERLEAVPWTALCIRHADPHPSANRPVEERVLKPPFGRTSLDDRDDAGGFDGEDAWQTVARYGTSVSPAMAEKPDEFTYEDPYLESDEAEGFVEPAESFLATDITGKSRGFVRNGPYRTYMEKGEGDRTLERSGDGP